MQAPGIASPARPSPFVYLVALEDGRTPNDIVEDRSFTVDGWTPGNPGGKRYGNVALDEALALRSTRRSGWGRRSAWAGSLSGPVARYRQRAGRCRRWRSARRRLFRWLTAAYQPFALEGSRRPTRSSG
ncbi:MAG: hypothetical protein R3C69_01095 [Geminicoccaceae bacterium]